MNRKNSPHPPRCYLFEVHLRAPFVDLAGFGNLEYVDAHGRLLLLREERDLEYVDAHGRLLLLREERDLECAGPRFLQGLERVGCCWS
jgi:hypothetical protein